MPKQFWKSLRSRILLLAVLTFLFLAGAAFSFFAYLRSSQTAILTAAERHLIVVASGLSRSYTDRADGTLSLSSLEHLGMKDGPRSGPPATRAPDGLPPAPPPPAPLHPAPLHPPHPEQGIASDPLTLLTMRALRQEPGIEGGFYAAESNELGGYAFPTHEGPGPSKEMPQRERPTIEALVRDAVAAGGIRTTRFEGPHDAVLFVAVPVREKPGSASSELSGAVWLMQRMPGVTGGRSRQLLWGSLGFGAAALITALLTFFVTGEVRNGVNTVLSRLSELEGGLFVKRAPAASEANLEEFNLVLRGIDTLALSLQEKILNERTLEAEMRHKERLSALGQFAAGIAHELRNPLATIRLRTQMSERTHDLEGVGRNSKVILEEIDRLDSIIGRLLYFARPIQLHLELVALDELCLTTANTWKQREAAHGVEIRCDAASGASFSCDRSRILQVLDNLVENAVHSASSTVSGQVTIASSLNGAFAQIEVRDNGAGLDPETLSRALDPFFTTKESGTGLGLSISFEIVQAHYGELSLGNRDDGGAIAFVRIPRRDHLSEPFARSESEPIHG